MTLNEKRINPQEQRKHVCWELAWGVFISSSGGDDVLVNFVRRPPGPQSSMFALKQVFGSEVTSGRWRLPVCSVHNIHGLPWTFASPHYTKCLSTLFIRSEFQMETFSTVFETLVFTVTHNQKTHFALRPRTHLQYTRNRGLRSTSMWCNFFLVRRKCWPQTLLTSCWWARLPWFRGLRTSSDLNHWAGPGNGRLLGVHVGLLVFPEWMESQSGIRVVCRVLAHAEFWISGNFKRKQSSWNQRLQNYWEKLHWITLLRICYCSEIDLWLCWRGKIFFFFFQSTLTVGKKNMGHFSVKHLLV